MADKKGVLTMTGDVTAAQAALFQRAAGAGGFIARGARRALSRARTRRATTTRAKGARRTKRASAPKGRLKKGSPAAKRRMAALRKMQKR